MNRYLAAGAGVLLILAVLVWWLMPGGNEAPSVAQVEDTEVRTPTKSKKKILLADGVPLEPVEHLPLEEDPTIPVVTKTCKWIVEDERRKVPQWVMLDNLRDRGQLFVEDDLRCLTAAGVTPAILDFAERYQDQNALRRAERGE